MKCSNCNKYFTIGDNIDGIPNALGFLLDSGKLISVCSDYLVWISNMSQTEIDEFFENMEEKYNDE